jgi:ABC-type lipoprotein export system ATPase subunit
MTMLYEVEDLKFHYKLGNQQIDALRGVSLEIKQGEFVCLTGPSGSGKSTLLNILGMIESPAEGKVKFGGVNLGTLLESEKNEIRRHKIGFVFQSFNLFPVLKAAENVEYFLGRMGVSKKERHLRVQASMEAVGIWEQRNKKPLEMSGGQRQRVAIARALAKNPEVIIADEPTASLDQANGRQIMEIFKDLHTQNKVTIVVASHDPMVLSFVETQIKLRDGQILDFPGLHPSTSGRGGPHADQTSSS